MRDDLIGELNEGYLQVNSSNRIHWLTFRKDNPLSLNPIIYVPLQGMKIEAKAITDIENNPPEILQIPVAVYKREWDRGKYIEFKYVGDDLK